MLYRLLCQVPKEALAKELGDSGIEVNNLHSKEDLIEAVLQQIA